jgi:hypothetical protein
MRPGAEQSLLSAAALVVAALVGCASPSPVAPDLLIEPIQIESVEVLVTASASPPVVAHVRGVVGDGCSTLHSVSQARTGSSITITILRQRPRDAICTQIARLYDEMLRVEGPFVRGSYLLRVNDLERAFTVP